MLAKDEKGDLSLPVVKRKKIRSIAKNLFALGKFHFLLIKCKICFKYKKAGWGPDQVPGVTSNETVVHMWRSRRQKGSARLARASAGLVLVPCNGLRLCFALGGGTSWELLLAANLQRLSMAIHWVPCMDECRRDWIIPSLRTSMAGYPVIKYLSLCVGWCVPVCTQISWSLILEGRELVVSSILVSVICSLSSLFFFPYEWSWSSFSLHLLKKITLRHSLLNINIPKLLKNSPMFLRVSLFLKSYLTAFFDI